MKHSQLSRLLLALILLSALPACQDTADDDDASDDDDVSDDDDDDSGTDDDDSAADDDDSAADDDDSKAILVPPGDEPGSPGTLAGLRATGSWESIDWLSNQVEVTLVAPSVPGPPPLPGLELVPAPAVDPDVLAFDTFLKDSLVPAVELGQEVSR